jgi:hypothetical protein
LGLWLWKLYQPPKEHIWSIKTYFDGIHNLIDNARCDHAPGAETRRSNFNAKKKKPGQGNIPLLPKLEESGYEIVFPSPNKESLPPMRRDGETSAFGG